jgi:hypothetical protein
MLKECFVIVYMMAVGPTYTPDVGEYQVVPRCFVEKGGVSGYRLFGIEMAGTLYRYYTKRERLSY